MIIFLVVIVILIFLYLLLNSIRQRRRDKVIKKYKNSDTVKSILETYDEEHQVTIPTAYIEKVDELIRYGVFKKLGKGLGFKIESETHYFALSQEDYNKFKN